jgi:hypothetical protein
MTGSGPSGHEPPLRTADPADDDTGFFGARNTPVFVLPDDAASTGGSHLDDDDDELDSEFAPQPRQRLGKLTIGLAALLVAGGGFLGGLQVQQHEGSSSAANPFAAAAARRGTGTGTGGFGGFGGGGTGTGTRTGTGAGGGAGTGTGTGTGSGTGGGTATTSIPAVIGQIVSVSGDTVVVKNLGGKEVTVKLSGTTTITQTAAATDLKPGQNVTVSGTTGTDGTVTATAVGTH